jgi:hypothetical protein
MIQTVQIHKIALIGLKVSGTYVVVTKTRNVLLKILDQSTWFNHSILNVY